MLLTVLLSFPSKQLWMLLTVLLSLPKLPCLCVICVQMSEEASHCTLPCTYNYTQSLQ